ncbi:methyl-accepting chemotaxis protein [Cohnella rhizosphaerae]|uniref:Methyl-accepting chemotaxis protein n=1 Tax=Cohnella rhizosphaerae TaxID=1457232 RepID=A0A9X4KQH4_9BACL|nr:HAMP domain-containing methyl-accepting chemotaxis protein [Cohnella rhizosphaerae]MDG0809269.1 methyl-accepting chemotaxis protein [Cohnella rhizosphaerae]
MFRFSSRLVFKLSVMIMTILAILSAALIYLQVRNTKQASEEAIGSIGMHIAEAYAGQFDMASYGNFLKDEKENDLYWGLRNALNRYRLEIGALYVYTVKFDELGQPVILIDGQPKNEKTASPIGEVTDMPKAAIADVLAGKAAKTGIIHNPEYGDYLSSFAPLRDASGQVIGALGIDTDVAVSNTIYRGVLGKSMTAFVLMGALTLLVFLLIAWFMARALRPLGTIVRGAEAMACGDLAEAQRQLGARRVRSKDEIGQAYAAMTRMTERLSVTLGDVMQDVTATTADLVRSTDQFGAEAQGMVGLNVRMEQSIAQLADGASHQRTGAEESARSMEEISMAIQRVAEASSSVAAASADALSTAEHGRSAIRVLKAQVGSMSAVAEQTTSSVQTLNDYMQEIKPVLQSIASNADQTKILALNASIEAVRAGEHGAGFGVVAGEIRKLAESAAASATQVTSLLDQIRGESAQIGERMAAEAAEMTRGTALSGEVAALFDDTVDRFVFVNGHIQEISAAAEQLLAGSEEVAASVEQMSQISAVSAENAASIQRMSAEQLEAARRIADTTAQLKKRGAVLEAAVAKFKL